MTVGELLEKLSYFPPDREIFRGDAEWGVIPIGSHELVEKDGIILFSDNPLTRTVILTEDYHYQTADGEDWELMQSVPIQKILIIG